MMFKGQEIVDKWKMVSFIKSISFFICCSSLVPNLKQRNNEKDFISSCCRIAHHRLRQ